jgi:serralysin
MQTFNRRVLCLCSRDSLLFVFGASLAFAVIAATSFGADIKVVTGTGGGAAPHVKTFNAIATETSSFLPYGGGTTAGVRVAAGDITGDGTPDIVTGLGSDAPSHVKVFSGADQSEVRSFLAYGGSFSGGVYVAAGDINGDTHGDIITGAGTSATHVKVFSGATNNTLNSFLAYPGVSGGVRVASGDVDGDGRADIITGLGDDFASHVKVFSGANQGLLHSFFAYGGFSGGVYVAAGDVNGDSLADIITGAGAGGGTHVKVFSGADSSVLLQSFFAYPGVNNEVRVGAGDVNGDGYADIITGLGSGNASHVKVFSGLNLDPNNPLQSFFAYGSYLGGVYVAGVTPVSRVPVVPECSTLALACIGMVAAGSRAARARRR